MYILNVNVNEALMNHREAAANTTKNIVGNIAFDLDNCSYERKISRHEKKMVCIVFPVAKSERTEY